MAGRRSGGSTPTERWTMVAVVLGSGVVFLDSTVVNVALPRIGQELSSTFLGVLEAQSYIYNAYLLSLSSLLILAGALADRFGRKRLFTLGLASFGATSLLCGLAPTMELLIAFRVLQGAAGAMLVPGSLALINATFHGEAQGRAYGVWAGASAATTIVGPFVGGVLVDGVSWRAIFLINLPLVLFGLYATARFVQESRDEDAVPGFDWIGAAAIALAVGGLSFGTIRGQQVEWASPLPFVALAVGAVATISFPFLERRSPNPLVLLDLFRSRNFSVANVATVLIYGSLYVTFYFLGLFVQGTIGYSAAAAGVAGIPSSVLLALLSSRMGALSARYGQRIFLTIAPVIMALGILWFVRVPADGEAWAFRASDPGTYLPPADYLVDFLPGLLVFGLGLTLLVAPITTAVMTSIPSRNAGVGSAINNAVSRVGPQLAGALIFVAVAASFASGVQERAGVDVAAGSEIAPLNPPPEGASPELRRAVRESSTDAFHLAMTISAGLLLAGAAVSGIGMRDVAARTEEERRGADRGAPADDRVDGAAGLADP
ncbi:MAG: MFS transporter [Actinomycetota bacterium]